MNATLLPPASSALPLGMPAPDSPPAVAAPAPGARDAQAFSHVAYPDNAQRLPLQFTGSGSEYFRIWIVNLLLTVLTLGLYHPWAKVRKLRYLYTNTQVGGHGLDFHGRPWKMLKGTLVAAGLFLLYFYASGFSAFAALLAALAASLVWPAMMRASLRFRLGHTSWRGLRFGFSGSTAGAYKAAAIPLLLFLGLPALGTYLSEVSEEMGQEILAGGGGALDAAQNGLPGVALLAGLMLASVLALPYFHWRLKQYQHGNYRLGALRSELRLRPGRVYGVYLRTLALAWLVPLVMALVVGAGAAVWGGAKVKFFLAVLLPLLMLFFYFFVLSYFQVGMQNLIWSRTGNDYVRFRSELPLHSYLLLQLKNSVLLALTLGLYWPWALIASRRMTVEAVTLVSRVNLDELTQALQARQGAGAADVLDDLMGVGLDFGL